MPKMTYWLLFIRKKTRKIKIHAQHFCYEQPSGNSLEGWHHVLLWQFGYKITQRWLIFGYNASYTLLWRLQLASLKEQRRSIPWHFCRGRGRRCTRTTPNQLKVNEFFLSSHCMLSVHSINIINALFYYTIDYYYYTFAATYLFFSFSLPPANIYLFYNRIYFHAFFIVPLSRSLFLRLSEAKANDDRLQRLGHTVFCHFALPVSIMYAYFVHSSFTMPVHAYHATYSYNIFIYYICIIWSSMFNI